MTDLLRKPAGARGLIHDITPQSAGWRYVGFAVHRLRPGEAAEGASPADRESLLVIVEGRARMAVDGRDYGVLGERMSVFEKTKPWCVYAPPGAPWRAAAETDAEIAVCTAPARGDHPAQVIANGDIQGLTRGKGANTRHINAIAMEEQEFCDSLLVTEVFTPAGNWSSYPPHRHDEDDFPRMTFLEETYYHRLNPPTGFALQRVFTEDGSLDETMAAGDRDVVLVPRGHHPVGAPYGIESYYLNVMAGPLRKWRFQNHPDFQWIADQDA